MAVLVCPRLKGAVSCSMSLHQLKSKNSGPRPHLGIETDSCRLLLQVARMDLD